MEPQYFEEREKKSDLSIVDTMIANAKEEEAKKNLKVKLPIIVDISVSQEDFDKYEECRLSCVTNMLGFTNVEMCTGLSRNKIKAIIKNYTELAKEFK